MRKTFLVIALIFIVIIAGLAAYLFYFKSVFNNGNNSNTNLTVNNSNASLNSNINTNAALNENTNQAVIDESESIKALSRLFAERYGSYSNENNFQYLEDLRIYMTPKMQQTTDVYITGQRAKITGNEPFFAVASETIANNILTSTASTAETQVTLRRTERNETSTTSTYFQNLLLKLNKVGDSWLVDSASWQEKISQ